MNATKNPVVYEGMQTPWGKADSATVYADGIGWVGTPSHGGCKLDRKRNAMIPSYMRQAGGWYEEDCDWCIPFVIFEAELKLCGDEFTQNTIKNGQHWHTFKNWHWKEYQTFTGTTIPEGESSCKDRDLFMAGNRNNWVAVSAIGIDNGMVEVSATLGGIRATGIEMRIFHVAEAEYDSRKFSYVIPEGMTPIKTRIW